MHHVLLAHCFLINKRRLLRNKLTESGNRSLGGCINNIYIYFALHVQGSFGRIYDLK